MGQKFIASIRLSCKISEYLKFNISAWTKAQLRFHTFICNLIFSGAHTLGKNHGSGATWVKDGSTLDNQYYKDLLDPELKWRKGVKPG